MTQTLAMVTMVVVMHPNMSCGLAVLLGRFVVLVGVGVVTHFIVMVAFLVRVVVVVVLLIRVVVVVTVVTVATAAFFGNVFYIIASGVLEIVLGGFEFVRTVCCVSC